MDILLQIGAGLTPLADIASPTAADIGTISIY